MFRKPRVIPPDQAWFWTERWQKMEREVDEDIAARRFVEIENLEDFFNYLDAPEDTENPV